MNVPAKVIIDMRDVIASLRAENDLLRAGKARADEVASSEQVRADDWEEGYCEQCGVTKRLEAENERLCNEAERNRIPLLQYASLRKHFRALIRAVLGPDYYNLGMDVYSCDAESCCDIAFKCSRRAGHRYEAARAALEQEAPHD